MNRVLDGLVLYWENFDTLHDLVKEEFGEDVVRRSTDALLA